MKYSTIAKRQGTSPLLILPIQAPSQTKREPLVMDFKTRGKAQEDRIVVLLAEPSGWLIDVDLDHLASSRAARTSDYLLAAYRRSAHASTRKASYLATKADNTRHLPSRELKAEDRDQRMEQATHFEKQAKSLEQRIKANEKAQEELVKRREAIEEQMRAW